MRLVGPQRRAALLGCWAAPTCGPPRRWPDRPSPASSAQRSPDRQARTGSYMETSPRYGVTDALAVLGHHAYAGVVGSRCPRAAGRRLPRHRLHSCSILDGRGRLLALRIGRD
eukprot:436508-Pyramimonas_sp.AAC.1